MIDENSSNNYDSEFLLSLDKIFFNQKRVLYRKGDPIFYQGEIPRYALLIKSGVIKAYDIGHSGDEKIVALITPGEFIPPAWVFNKSPVSMYYYYSFTDTEAYLLQRELVHKLIKENIWLARKLFNQYIGIYSGAVLQINALQQSKGTDKIIYILQHLIMRFGHSIGNNSSKIMLRLTHQDIANMTGLTRETTSVELNRLKNKGVIKYEEQHYTVNTKKLLTLLGSEDFANFNY